ncbi:MAG TPA: DUF5655 domain-containing protein [Gemmataceae bacterium]|nr:DUF5655 domain-containing protein [Gemmataceae bacterium]
MAKKPTKSLYSVHPGVKMVQDWIASLKEKSGRTLEEWIKHIKKEGPDDEKACGQWLKEQYQMGTNTAWWLAERALGKNKMGLADEDPASYLREAPQYVDEMYAGPKEALRPIYDELLHVGLAIASDVKACPCKTIVPLYRNHVFAQIKPTTRTRIDLGLSLKDIKTPARLIDTGGFAKKDRITRRIPISSLEEIDADVKKWLKVAYDMDA